MANNVSFSSPTSYETGGGDPRSVVVGDVNRDGTPDLVVLNASASVGVLLGDGAGGFGAPTAFPVTTTNSQPIDIAAGDFNNDGNLDLVTANFFFQPNTNTFSVLLGDGAGGFGSPVVRQSGGTQTYRVAVGDLNNDGNLDVVVTNRSSSNVSVLLGDGLGGFGTPTLLDDPEPGSSFGISVTIAALNEDGNLDLVTTNLSSDSASVRLGDGTGGFGTPTTYATGTLPNAIVVEDLNGDGNLDLAISNISSNNISVLLGDGLGGFGAQTTFASGTNSNSVVAGDFNNDGILDLATVGSSGGLSVLVGDGLGGFETPTNFATPTNSISLAVGDFNGDGELDLATPSSSTDRLLVFLNTTGLPPVAVDDAFTTDEDTAFSDDVFADNGSGVDSDPDGDTLTVTAVNGVAANVDTEITLPSGALLTLNSDGTFDYDPNGQFESLAAGETATDTFTYTVSDDNGGTDTATVTITINGAADNTPPAAVDDGLSAGAPSFGAAETNPFGLTNIGEYNSPTLADLDGDGDLDAFIGELYGDILYFENTGDASSPSFVAGQTNPFGLTNNLDYISAPTFADIDGDGDLDAFVGKILGDILYFENTGDASSPSFGSAQTNPFGLTEVGFYVSPTFADIDGDGDLDAFVGENDGDIFYFENTGSASSPSFDSVQTNPFGLTNVGRFSKPTFADIDGDGDLDAFVGERNGDTFYFENTGSADSPSFDSVQTTPFGLTEVGYGSPTFADIDDDGDLDAFIGERNGDTVFFENVATPVADPAFTTDEDTAFTTGNVLTNDSDPDEDTLTITGVDTTGTLGTVTDNGDGTFDYDPNGAFEFLATGETATDSFTYTIEDGNGETDTATVTITITGVTDAPLVQGQPATVFVDDNNIVVGNTFQVGGVYDGNLFSNTDLSLDITNNPDDVIQGTPGNDNIWAGSDGSDIIDGGAGNDTIGFGDGDASVQAGDGDDFIYPIGNGGGTNQIDLGAGNDNFSAPAGDHNITGSDNNLIGLGLGNDTVTTSDGDDFVYTVESGGGGDNILDLGDGMNTVYVENGNYNITTGSGADSIGLGDGMDTINAGDGENIIYMIDANGTNDGDKDVITGSGDDFIQTGSGDDLIDAGTGLNTIQTGAGADTVILRTGAYNFYSDFELGIDQFQLENLTFSDLRFFPGTGDTATDAFIFVGSEAIGQVANISVAELNNSANFV